MNLTRIVLAALIYATLMTGWAIHRAGGFEPSHLLRFVFYAVIFGFLFGFLMRYLEKRKAKREGRG